MTQSPTRMILKYICLMVFGGVSPPLFLVLAVVTFLDVRRVVQMRALTRQVEPEVAYAEYLAGIIQRGRVQL